MPKQKLVSRKPEYLILGMEKTPFTIGWRAKEDETDIPLGGARDSVNMQITDRGGIAPRPGEMLIGTYNTGTDGVSSGFSFKKSSGKDILGYAYSDKIVYYNNKANKFSVLQYGYTPNLKFDFKEDKNAIDPLDWLYFGNQVDKFSRWCGYEATIKTALVGAEVTVAVDTTLTPDVYYSGTASSVTTTSITIAASDWVDNEWNGIKNVFYVRITSGAASGKIAIIYATTPTTLTFPTIAGLVGTPTFEIRKIAVPLPCYSGTASAVTTTTLNVAGTPWTTDQWNGYYVAITSGAAQGKVAKISATTTNQITFPTITGLAGTPTFQIQNYPGYQDLNLIYNGVRVPYTAIPTDSSFTVTSAAAASIGEAVTVTPQVFPGDPKGNILETSREQMFISGTLKGPQAIFRSRIADATDFTFADPRAANEGDFQLFPYYGGKISDIKWQEGSLYIIKKHSIESLIYTQTTIAVGTQQAPTDVAQITTIKAGVNVGSEARAWRMDDDIAFITPDKRLTTIGRVTQRDQLPQSTDIADPITRKMKTYIMDDVFGIQHNNCVYIAVKEGATTPKNNLLLVRKETEEYRCWQSRWHVSASTLIAHNENLYYGHAYSPNIYQLNIGLNRVRGADSFAFDAKWRSGWINARQTGFYVQEVSRLAVEGYITAGDEINFNLYKNFAVSPFRMLQLKGTETQFQDNAKPAFSMLGGDPLGLLPLGGVFLGEPDEDNRRHFIVVLPFKQQPLEYISIEVMSNKKDSNWEVLKLGINATMADFEAQQRIKTS